LMKIDEFGFMSLANLKRDSIPNIKYWESILMPQSAELNDALLQAVDDGLLVPGEIVRAAIYERIERSYQVTREQIPEKLPTFHKALQELLGASAKVLEKMIVKNLYSRVGLSFTERQNWTLVDYVNHAKELATGGQVYGSCSGVEEKV